MAINARRRQFIFMLGSASAAWPLAAWGQQPSGPRKLGVMMPEAESSAESIGRKAKFEEALAKLGWKVGSNLAIDYRWAVNGPDRADRATAELLALGPDLIVAVATPAARAAYKMIHSIPVVFVAVSEPVSQGIVASLARPGGNLTGFSNLEGTFGEKWLELLKEIAPTVMNVGIAFNPDSAPFLIPIANATVATAAKLGIKAESIAVRGQDQIEAAIARLAAEVGSGFIFPPDAHTSNQAKWIAESCIRYKIPAVYGLRLMVVEGGGLMSYGIDLIEIFRDAAGYVDRILKGEKPANLPVQQPTKYELIINLKAAKAIDLSVPTGLLVRANEVIE
jgi:putative tryptophan/tyrosine transport system substrate-binding protein